MNIKFIKTLFKNKYHLFHFKSKVEMKMLKQIIQERTQIKIKYFKIK